MTVTLEKRYFKFMAQWLGVICFLYLVVLNDGISTPMKALWLQPFMQIISEFLILDLNAGIAGWLQTCTILIISCLLWSSFICFLFYPRGFKLKESQVNEHISFSRVIASMTLFQIVRVVRIGRYSDSDPIIPIGDRFFWVPILMISIIILCYRMFARVRSGYTTFKMELQLLLPFFVGIAFIGLSWNPIISPLRNGGSIALTSAGPFVNIYTIIFNILMAVCCIGMFLVQKKKGMERLYNEKDNCTDCCFNDDNS